VVQINRRTWIDYLFGGLFNENRGLFKREKRRQDSAKKNYFKKFLTPFNAEMQSLIEWFELQVNITYEF